jgi:hypothetical protein
MKDKIKICVYICIPENSPLETDDNTLRHTAPPVCGCGLDTSTACLHLLHARMVKRGVSGDSALSGSLRWFLPQPLLNAQVFMRTLSDVNKIRDRERQKLAKQHRVTDSFHSQLTNLRYERSRWIRYNVYITEGGTNPHLARKCKDDSRIY